MRAVAWNSRWLNLIDQSLQLDLVALDLGKVTSVAKSNVFKTMDLTK